VILVGEALRTDLYQLTMMQAYWKSGHNPIATFDYFVRRIPYGSYLLVAGLAYILEYIKNLGFEEDDLIYLKKQGFDEGFLDYLKEFRFTGDVLAMPEGEIAFPREPIIRVTAPIMESQLVETYLLNKMNFSTLIATKASRVAYAAQGRPVAEFGLRRAQGDGHLEATRASFIGGCATTSNVLAGKLLGIPISGTMAHSFVTSFDQEIDSFRAYADCFPLNCFLLIDTYNTLEGARKAAVVGKELEARGYRLVGVRLDSGDIAELSGKVREILDKAKLDYVKIIASGDLNEFKIQDMLARGAKVDGFGVGTELVTGKPNPALDGIYKLSEIVDERGSIPKMKLSEEEFKATLPGRKTVFRVYEDDRIMKDIMALEDEKVPGNARKVPVQVVEKGEIVFDTPSLKEIRENARKNLELLPKVYRGISDTPQYPVELSLGLKNLREKVVEKIKGSIR